MIQQTNRFGAALVGAVALALPLAAQPSAGDKAPNITIDATFNGAATSFDDLNGKAVLLDLFATW